MIELNTPQSSNLFVGSGGDDASAKVLSFKFMLEIDILAPKTNSP